jgi:SnoaL-like domain
MNEFRAAVEAQDLERLVALLDEDVVFRSPVVFKPYRGRDQVAVVFAAVARVLEDFRYQREIGAADASDRALVFRARVGDRELEGCDLLHTNDAGLIDEFVVMVRPLSAALALVERMKGELAAAETEVGGH